MDNWKKFTQRLFNEWDADPGYYAIQLSKLPHTLKMRFTIGWCAFYNLGVAADAAQFTGSQFYDYLRAVYPVAKRNSERRHFRGKAGLLAIDQWEKFGPPEKLAESFHKKGGDYADVRSIADQTAQMGPYFAWKWCDLNEVLWGDTIKCEGFEHKSPSVPQQGARLIFPKMFVDQAYAIIKDFGIAAGVPCRTASRDFDVQEAETVCCVYKQMANGKYIYGSRTAKAIARLNTSSTKTAREMKGTLLDISPYTESELEDILVELKEHGRKVRQQRV